MKVKFIPSSWLRRDGRRLDCGPYLSGALEAKVRLEELEAPKEHLHELTHGHKGGIYNGPKFSRTWVRDPEFGVPFVGSSAMLQADLSELPLLSRKDAESPRLSYLRLRPGMTLISCSGTIGRMVYCRQDMDGIWASQHIMKVVPNPARVSPGYLFAYLSSKFGVPLIMAGTYGSIIQSIEPHHIADLPVPRLGNTIEGEIHQLVETAARLRVEANSLLKQAVAQVLEAWGVAGDVSEYAEKTPDVRTVSSSRLHQESRFDAFYYGSAPTESDRTLNDIADRMPIRPLGDVVSEVFETTRFGRVTVEDPAWGVPFLSISDLVRFDPRTDALVSRKQVERLRALVHSGWLILPRVGQIHGVFGTVCYIPEHLDGVAVSDNNIRILPEDEVTGAYLWAALTTKICYLQVVRRACGTSIPYLDAKRVASIPVPWPAEGVRAQVASLVCEAMAKRSRATRSEDEARRQVEAAIEEAS